MRDYSPTVMPLVLQQLFMHPSTEAQRYSGREEPAQRAITVLHVDDDPDFSELVSIYLERESRALEVLTETNVDDALERLDDAAVDCIVSDYEMPGRDGLEFLETVRERELDVPFILFTGKGSEEIASDAISAGVTDYLQKERGTDQYTVLAHRVENAVEQHYATREVERGFSAIETAREGIAFLDEEGTFQYVNAAYAEVYGYDREEMVGEHWEILYPEDHVQQIHEDILPSVPENDRWSGESVQQRKNGERLVVDHALTYTDDGTLLCLVQDITEEKEVERSLERERRRFEQFIDAVEVYAIFSLDTEGFVTSWNRGAERLSGYESEEILGRHFSVFYPEAKAEIGYPDELLETALAEGSVQDEGWRVRKDGSRFWAKALITAVFDDDGTHQGFLKVIRDTTERHERARSPDVPKDLLDYALDVLDDVFYLFDPEGNIVRVGEQATVTGYSREELLSMSPLELFSPEVRPRVESDIERALETGSATTEAPILTKDGDTVPFEFRKRRIVDDDGNVYVAGIGRDIRDRQRRERRLRRQLAQFDEFASVLSHDLRTPLNVVRGRLELARDSGETDHLEQAEAALDRLDELIGNLAGVMREGELVTDVTAVDLGAASRSAWDALETAGATLAVETDRTIHADEGALTRLLENLLKNAIEHGEGTVTVTVGDLPKGFYVADNGPGIPEAERDDVFEIGTTVKEGEHGVGLASVKQLAVAHGWEISVTESDAGGARFEISDVESV
jgi:PAS domain S-box-containing protein